MSEEQVQLTDAKLMKRLAASRLFAIDKCPYFARALFALAFVRELRVITMAVDQYWRCYWNPFFVAAYGVEELGAVLIHEVEHLVQAHSGRRLEREPLQWNVAADLEINDDLTEQRLQLPEGRLHPNDIGLPTGLTAEQYYETEAAAKLAGELRDKLQAGGALPGMGRSGSCATGKREVWEKGEPGEGKDKDGISPDEGEMIRRQVAKDIISQSSKEPGTVPGGLKRWAQNLLKPRVDWRTELRALVRHAVNLVRGKTDYTRTRPSRRQTVFYGQKVEPILPAFVTKIPRVAIAVDTSGSMPDEALQQGLAEVKGVLDALGNAESVQVLSVDAEVHTCNKVFDAKQVELVGGGGTDTGKAVEAALKLNPHPDVLVIFTDGYTPWPDKPPTRTKVVVCCTTEDGECPSWARTVRLPKLLQTKCFAA